MTSGSDQPQPMGSVTGVQLAQGIGHQPARGFWAEAWSYVVRRPRAIFGLAWVAIVAFFAVYAPVLASGHPITMLQMAEDGSFKRVWPLFEFLTQTDVVLLVLGSFGLVWTALPMGPKRVHRVWYLILITLQALLAIVFASMLTSYIGSPDRGEWARAVRSEGNRALYTLVGSTACAALAGAFFFLLPTIESLKTKLLCVLLGATLSGGVLAMKWSQPLQTFEYSYMLEDGIAKDAVYTLVPFSPNQSSTSWFFQAPGTTVAEAEQSDEEGGFRFILGTDSGGRDVLSQMMHASRLSISIGLVSTSIAVVIGVTIGALMGYFGGWVDILLFRVVEVFMAIPVLFLLIVAAGVLPRNIYVMMIIIGCFTWTGAARFTRAEFLKLRNQDFVQSAKAAGLPLRSILFKHMLPNGVTPVLVDASFAIAAAILIEAILSFLGLGPADQASWGKLLRAASDESGSFQWWLAIFPGAAIFLTVLAYNLIGETMRDAIDPKLKKARV